ncbi:MAG: hypothetical protein MR008_03700 [Aerococcus sp.]|nr:hypothetical protein [Aerococcus sp.]
MVSNKEKLSKLRDLIPKALANQEVQQLPKLRAILENYQSIVDRGKLPIEMVEEFSAQLSWFVIEQKKPIPNELIEILKLIKKNKWLPGFTW